MNTQHTPLSIRLKVGLFTLLGLLLVVAVTFYVNDRPFWWRPCQLVHINVEDATGLKTKSPIRSLGLQIGYLESVELFETYVRLGICVTAPVDVLPTTRAYIRGEGFLGDKFVELRPVKYVGPNREDLGDRPNGSSQAVSPGAVKAPEGEPNSAPGAFMDWNGDWRRILDRSLEKAGELLFGHSAFAQTAPPRQATRNGRDIPVGEKQQDVEKLVQQVDGLVVEMKQLTNNLKESINPTELRQTMTQLNRTLENASKTLSPAGGLNTTAQRTLEKLEDGIEQLRDIMTRVNKGEGSIGMLLNDPVYAQEIRETIRNLNLVINRIGRVRMNVDLYVEEINALNGGRGVFQLNIWPTPSRYYRLGISSDPRGSLKVVDYTTTVNGQSTTVGTTQIEQGGLVLTVQFGKLFYNRLDIAAGLLYGDGALSLEVLLGPLNSERLLRVHGDTYTRGRGNPLDERLWVSVQPFMGAPILGPVYFRGGLESVHKVNGSLAWAYGAGITFDDEDLRVLFAFR